MKRGRGGKQRTIPGGKGKEENSDSDNSDEGEKEKEKEKEGKEKKKKGREGRKNNIKVMPEWFLRTDGNGDKVKEYLRAEDVKNYPNHVYCSCCCSRMSVKN